MGSVEEDDASYDACDEDESGATSEDTHSEFGTEQSLELSTIATPCTDPYHFPEVTRWAEGVPPNSKPDPWSLGSYSTRDSPADGCEA